MSLSFRTTLPLSLLTLSLCCALRTGNFPSLQATNCFKALYAKHRITKHSRKALPHTIVNQPTMSRAVAPMACVANQDRTAVYGFLSPVLPVPPVSLYHSKDKPRCHADDDTGSCRMPFSMPALRHCFSCSFLSLHIQGSKGNSQHIHSITGRTLNATVNHTFSQSR